MTPEKYKAECPHERTGSGNPLEGATPTSAALVQTEDKGTGSADLMPGGSESNTLQGLGGHDLLRGGAGDDTLLGGADRIDDNSGPTVVSTGANTGPGVDRVDVADGKGDDTVTCTTPQTTVVVDPGDEVEGQCGQVIREGG